MGRRGLSPTRKQTSSQQIKPSLCQCLQHSCVTGFPEQSGPVSHSADRYFLLTVKVCIIFHPQEMEFISYLLPDSPLSLSKQFQASESDAAGFIRVYVTHGRNTLNMCAVDCLAGSPAFHPCDSIMRYGF